MRSFSSASVTQSLPCARADVIARSASPAANDLIPALRIVSNRGMKIRKIALSIVGVLAVAGAAGWFSLDKETRGLLATFPTNRDLLFWNEAQRDAAFRARDRIPLLARAHVVFAGPS